jgi:hypothetical protein
MGKSRNLLVIIGVFFATGLCADDVRAGSITDLKVTTRGSKVILEFETGSARADEMTLLVNIVKSDDLVKIGEGAVEGCDYGVVSLGPRKRMIWNIQNSSDDYEDTAEKRNVFTIRSSRRTGYEYNSPIFAGF